MREPTLKSLIKKQRKRILTLRRIQGGYDYPDMQAYYVWVETTKRFLRLHFLGDESVVEFCKLSKESISPSQQENLLAILKAIDALPVTIKNDIQIKNEKETNFVVNNYITQSRNQNNRKQTVNAENYNGLVKPRSGIMAKLKTVCVTVVIGVLVDLLSDLTFWQWLHSQLELIIGRLLF